jgi:hypothetical protein
LPARATGRGRPKLYCSDECGALFPIERRVALSAVEHSIAVARQFGPIAPGEPGGPELTTASKADAQVLDAALAACAAALEKTSHAQGDTLTLIAQAAAALALAVELVEPDPP